MRAVIETARKMDSSFKDSQLKFYISARTGHGINTKLEKSKSVVNVCVNQKTLYLGPHYINFYLHL